MTSRYVGPHGTRSEVETRRIAYSDIQAGYGVAQYDVVYIDGNFFAQRADPTSSTAMPARGLALGSALSGGYFDLLKRGIYSNAGWEFTSGSRLYVGSGGQLVTTVPSASGRIVQGMGWAINNDVIDFDVEDDFINIAV